MLVVTTPQEAARKVAERAGKMAERTNLRPIGVIENMSYYVCPHCGERDDIFGTGGGQEAADTLGVPLMAQVPLMPALREGGDTGTPLVISDPDAPASIALREAARHGRPRDQVEGGQAADPDGRARRRRTPHERARGSRGADQAPESSGGGSGHFGPTAGILGLTGVRAAPLRVRRPTSNRMTALITATVSAVHCDPVSGPKLALSMRSESSSTGTVRSRGRT